MSRYIQTIGKRTRAKNTSTRLVLVFLADHAGKDFLAWPSQATLARLSGVSDRTVRNALRELEALGEIRVVTHGQGRRSTVYRIELLASQYEVIEPDGNRKRGSGLELAETGRRGPVCENGKPEAQRRQTGSRLPIEEIEVNTPSFSPSETAGEDGAIAEKREAPAAPVFPSKSTDITRRTVTGHLVDHAREDQPSEIEQWATDLRARHPEMATAE